MAKLLVEVNCGIILCVGCSFYRNKFFTKNYCHFYKCAIKNGMRCDACLAAGKAVKTLEDVARFGRNCGNCGYCDESSKCTNEKSENYGKSTFWQDVCDHWYRKEELE